jgi:hypothetical protein
MVTILESPFAVQIIYPFLLIFTIFFAILQRSKILGEDKKQIDALVAFSIALITIAFSWATGVIVKLMPFLAISVVIILVFMILWGFVASTNGKGLELSKGLQNTFLVIIIIALVIAVIVATGQWDYAVKSLFSEGGATSLAGNILMLVIIGGAIAVVFASPKGKTSSGKSSSE